MNTGSDDPRRTGAASKPRILVVEDDPGTARLIELTLREAGFGTTLAPSEEEALDELRAEPHAAATVDLVLGNETSFNLVRTLTREYGLPVLVVTAWPHLRSELRDVRAEYLRKPFHPEELAASVRDLVMRRGRFSGNGK